MKTNWNYSQKGKKDKGKSWAGYDPKNYDDMLKEFAGPGQGRVKSKTIRAEASGAVCLQLRAPILLSWTRRPMMKNPVFARS